MNHVGARWYKCDFHVHTMASKCFANKDVTAQDWVNAAIDKGLNCVAVTDHNTGDGIDAIVEAARDTSLTVFPGVEITCSESKVHLLILFDLVKSSQFVNDFLIKCEIDRDKFASAEAHSQKSILEIIEIARDNGGIVIPAHIDDEHVGFNRVASVPMQNIFPHFRAAQTVCSQHDWVNKKFKKVTSDALEYNLSLLTFSDNPDTDDPKKHGIAGIGDRYTWIKMGEAPSLEGLRQALLLPDVRIKNDFESTTNPAKVRKQWIKSIKIDGTSITAPDVPLEIKFNPQLNTIIGGRGSGKSSILRFLRGVFNKTTDLTQLDSLKEILEDHRSFYQVNDGSSAGKGVFLKTSDKEHVVVEFVKNDAIFRISVRVTGQEKDTLKYRTKIDRFDEPPQEWVSIEESEYLTLFDFQLYSQKQVYEMAGNTNSLKNLIDDSDATIKDLKATIETLRSEHVTLATEIAGIRRRLDGEATTLARKKENDDSLGKLMESGLLSAEKQIGIFKKQQVTVEKFHQRRSQVHECFESLISSMGYAEVDTTGFSEEYANEISDISKRFLSGIISLKNELSKSKTRFDELMDAYDKDISESGWEKARKRVLDECRESKENLKSSGIDVTAIEHLFEQQKKIDAELKSYEMDREKLIEKETTAALIRERFLAAIKDITTKRREVGKRLTQGKSVAIQIQAFGDEDDFEKQLRKILGIDTNTSESYAKDMLKIVDFYKQSLKSRSNDAVQAINATIEMLTAFANNNPSPPIELGGYTRKKLKDLDQQKRYEFQLLFPDDRIIVKYKPQKQGDFKSLGTASPGQKTAAILSVILSQNDTPLLLDQPEDDLDNKIIFDLIVQGVLEGKQHRQMIIVTHNANIPVNGDAEYIVSMNSSSEKIAVLHCGTIEDKMVKKEICDVMEGSEEAFRRRAEKYGHITEVVH